MLYWFPVAHTPITTPSVEDVMAIGPTLVAEVIVQVVPEPAAMVASATPLEL